jgi:glutaconate CoA-transferase subunit A
MSAPEEPRRTAQRRTPIVIEPPDIRKYLFDGMTLAIGGFINSSHPMTLVREVIRSGVKDIRVVGAAMSGLEIDMLIAAGSVRQVVSSFVSGEVYAPIAPMYRWAVEENEVTVWDCDEMMYYSALRAGAMRVPFMPVRSGLGTSMPELNPDLKQFTEPVSGTEVLAIPAIRPDLALLHGDQADAYGNVQITGTGFGDRAMFRAADVTIVQVERIVTSEHIRLEPTRTVYNRIEAIVRAPFGCHPFGSPGNYREDGDYLRAYVDVVRKARAANDRAAVTAWIDENIRESGDHLEYLERLGVRALVDMLESEEVVS